MNERKTSLSANKIMVASGLVFLGVAAVALARKLWTDENYHDPGITELEGLTYTIDDFSRERRKKWKRRKDK